MKKTTKIEVRFADIDAMGHVNNAIFLNYFEQARMDFFNSLVGSKWDWKKDGIVLARNEVDYLAPIFLGDEVMVETTVEKIGSKSMTLSYVVFKNKQEARHFFAKGASVIVSYDYQKGTATLIPDSWKKAFGAKNEV